MKLPNQKGFTPLILVIIIIGIFAIVGGGIWYYRQFEQTSQSTGATKPVKQSTPKQTFNTLPSLVKAEFNAGVSETDKNFIVQGISGMDFYLKKWFGKSINKSAGLKVRATASSDPAKQAETTVEDEVMIINLETESEVWKRQTQSSEALGGEWHPRLASHEYVHVYQFQNGCGGGLIKGISSAPPWFIEGEAEWLSYKANKETGLLPPMSISQLVIFEAKKETNSLKYFENPENKTFSAYFLFNMALDYLMSGRPIAALNDFCTNLGSGLSTSQAFEKSFNITLDKFYQDFESYRKTWSNESPSDQIPPGYREYCAQFTSLPSCSSVGAPGSPNYDGCKQCYPNK